MSDQSENLPETIAVVPNTVARFGPPPLLQGEDASAYGDLLRRISAALKPLNIVEDIWVRDVVDLSWEILRLRQQKNSFLRANAHKGLKVILETTMEWQDAKTLAQQWAAREAAAIAKVDDLLASMGLTMDAVMAQTLALKINDIERIDRMTMTAETRRNVALRELDRHRAVLEQVLRRANEQIEEGQFKEVAAENVDRGAA